MSSQRYINAASEYTYISILIYNTFCSATFYNDPPMITHAVAQELGPQEVKLVYGMYVICRRVLAPVALAAHKGNHNNFPREAER